MSSTQIARVKDGVVDVVYSPDDGGYYLQRYRFSEKRDEVSKRIFSSVEEARKAYERGRLRWEK